MIVCDMPIAWLSIH